MAVSSQPNLDDHYYAEGHTYIAGVDEVGRGCWAGPLVAAAVIMPPEQRVPGVSDSKLLTAKQREGLFLRLVKAAMACSVVSITAAEVDQFGLHHANLFALSYCVTHLPLTPDVALIDGFTLDHFIPTVAVVDGDAKSYSIAAASIIAKVMRDRLMRRLDQADGSRYGFAQHKGYGTALHRARLQHYGVSQWHRRSFAPIHSMLYT